MLVSIPRSLDFVTEQLPNSELRLAEEGEFTQRAFLNGKIGKVPLLRRQLTLFSVNALEFCVDLTQVEGLADLLSAKTEFQRKQSD